MLHYLICLVLMPALFYPLAFLIVTLCSYEHWATNPWGPALEYPYTTRAPDADVVVFGDSSAFLGVDPRTIQDKLGVRAIVIPDTAGSIPVTGDEPLAHYLAHHSPPRLIVLYFSSWNLEFDNATQSRLYEGEEMLLRHASRSGILSFALRHPTELLVFPFRLYSTFGPKLLKAVLHHVDRQQPIADALGHVDFNQPFAALNSDCRIPSRFMRHEGAASVRQLAQRFQSGPTRVLVYVAPVPGCVNAGELSQRSFAALGASPPAILPAESFAGDAYYAHVRPEAVPVVTQRLIDAIQANASVSASLRLPTGDVKHP